MKIRGLAVAVLLLVCGLAQGEKKTSAPGKWVGTWACAPIAQAKSDKTAYANTTVRDVVHVSLGGEAVRFRISNLYGSTSLVVGPVHAALSAGGGKIAVGSDHAVMFGGTETVTVPPGASVWSDAVMMPVAALSDVVVSAYLPEQTLPVMTEHTLGSSATYHAEGNQTSAVEMPKATKTESWMLLTGVDVLAPESAAAVVTLGDSITDGAHSTPDKNARWPDVLAERLHKNAATANVGVLNVGISGNRILHDHAATGALARFDHDVLAQSGVKYLVVLESINDIHYATMPRTPEDVVTAEQLIWGLQQIVLRAHAHGIKVYGATLTPFGGSRAENAAGEVMRSKINAWIRTSGVFDAVIDFDSVVRDPAHMEQFWPANDSGDHLHPGDAGYKAMGEAVDLKLFQ